MVPTIQRLPARCATALRDNCAKLRNARATPCALAEGAVQNAVCRDPTGGGRAWRSPTPLETATESSHGFQQTAIHHVIRTGYVACAGRCQK